jgi:putative phosphoribosyl transferase
MTTAIQVPAGDDALDGDLAVPDGARGAVLFAHGSGSSRHSPRNRAVAETLQDAGLATLLLDLLTHREERVDARTREHRFDIALLARRLVLALDWLRDDARTAGLSTGMFGASTGAGAALVAATERPDAVCAVVSRGGRPDLAGDALPRVACPTLLLVGSRDDQVITLNEQARERLTAPTSLRLIEGAGHLFEEPGTLEQVAAQARDWFVHHCC